MTSVIGKPCADVVERASVWECPVGCIYEGHVVHPPRRVRGFQAVTSRSALPGTGLPSARSRAHARRRKGRRGQVMHALPV